MLQYSNLNASSFGGVNSISAVKLPGKSNTRHGNARATWPTLLNYEAKLAGHVTSGHGNAVNEVIGSMQKFYKYRFPILFIEVF